MLRASQSHRQLAHPHVSDVTRERRDFWQAQQSMIPSLDADGRLSYADEDPSVVWGPQVRKNAPAPWETDDPDEDDSHGSSLSAKQRTIGMLRRAVSRDSLRGKESARAAPSSPPTAGSPPRRHRFRPWLRRADEVDESNVAPEQRSPPRRGRETPRPVAFNWTVEPFAEGAQEPQRCPRTREHSAPVTGTSSLPQTVRLTRSPTLGHNKTPSPRLDTPSVTSSPPLHSGESSVEDYPWPPSPAGALRKMGSGKPQYHLGTHPALGIYSLDAPPDEPSEYGAAPESVAYGHAFSMDAPH